MDGLRSRFAEWLREGRLELSESQRNMFETYYRELIDWNEKMNLTGITEREQVYVKHFYDSLTLSFFVPMENVATVADIGSGAGFPGVPLKIAYPHIKLTIIDSLNKRIRFLRHLVEKLQLTNVECVHARAEDAARQPVLRDAFDLVTARAVARLNVLNELCLPFVKVGGLFAAMKGTDPSDEIGEAAFSLRQLKGETVAVRRLELPVDRAERHIVMIRKLAPTPKLYPRKAGTPLKDPLTNRNVPRETI